MRLYFNTTVVNKDDPCETSLNFCHHDSDSEGQAVKDIAEWVVKKGIYEFGFRDSSGKMKKFKLNEGAWNVKEDKFQEEMYALWED